MRESRNFNQLFSGDSRFVINGSSLQIRSPSKRHDEAIYLCRLTVSRRDHKIESFHASNGGAISPLPSSTFGSQAFELERQFAEAANADSRSPQASDSLFDLNLVHQSSLAASSASSTSVSASCINSMQDIFAQPAAVSKQQDFSDQVTLAMSSISIRIVGK